MPAKYLSFAFFIAFAIAVESRAAITTVSGYTVAVGDNQLFEFPDGETWEYGNDLLNPDVNDSSSGFSLAVGDSFRIDTRLTRSVILSDGVGEEELFRAFLLRSPDRRDDVSSIQTSARVTFYGLNGEELGTIDSESTILSWPYEHYPGEQGNFGIEHILRGDIVEQGESIEIAGWLFELEILADPNGLLATSEWPWASFAFKADEIAIGDFTSPDSSAVPEPASLAIWIGIGIGGLACAARRLTNR
jgi:hypothetical protein